MKIIGEIPARYGSKRIINKNLRLINGKPLISYAINAAKNSTTLSDIFVNSESDVIGRVAQEYGVKFYKRPHELGSDTATSDQFNYDFIKNVQPDILVMINPVSPLITGSDIDTIVHYFLEHDFDTLISIKEEKLQAFCDGKPINIDTHGALARTQDILPIQICSWAVTIWRKKTFLESFENNGYAVFSGRVGFYPLHPLKAIKISYEEDFILAELMLKSKMIESY